MLEIRDIQKTFGSQTALSSVNLSVAKGEFFSLLGPSGCGKSTLLRILAGLEEPSGGEIRWSGQRIDQRINQLPARERPFNMVFQKYALFPHLSVYENIAFGLKLKKLGAREIKERVFEALELVSLLGFESRLPETLSGGQSQRVALARALVNRPECILLDEPLTALDQKLREHMQTELRLLQKRLGLTFIFVTHDQEEAMLLSDRIAVMNSGRIEQVSTPRELYEAPASLFCARFIGRRNELAGEVVRGGSEWLEIDLGGASVKGRSICERLRHLGQGTAQAFVRPERLRVLSQNSSPKPGANLLAGEVVQILFRGIQSEVIVGCSDSLFIRSMADASEVERLRVGDRVDLEFFPEDTHLFLAGT